MSESLVLAATDRVLVIAPHPDDESIACGGLLLAARDAGAARRVVTLTDGDNNPWPQRWIEKRWRIDAAARTRWGARRRAEAHAALDILGVEDDQRIFLGLADGALTAHLMRDTSILLDPIREHIAQFRPNIIALPALDDRHPDHSAAHLAARRAVPNAATESPRWLSYSVHGDSRGAARIGVELNAAQQRAKQQAIACHETQMRLSGARFLAFAAALESYRVSDPATMVRSELPLRARANANGTLDLELAPRRGLRRELAGRSLFLFAQMADGSDLRWQIPVSGAGRQGALVDLASGQARAQVIWQRHGDVVRTSIALPTTAALVGGYIKLARISPGLVIYDREGWQSIEFPT